ncbi:inosose dehydratase [Gibbsiella quercinecans]|uniref:Myo-inosose-2 dehydratase n=1 Tax=Gibbsiella quercinecans TaxID=929813 RepID=A0A250B2I4_9GAMM|nr:myo-inosose-2 dehydratase [Gibbsiella quercinecans]ATA20448.1 myo-inosose-2 dehydratase [Gibbsiella quercinecans]RLM07456.1 myo-inosose-2 dehydratase [Gibbsiella quercinecans]TCT89416.1 inosose dehydratase [Gibbsiella quercinecans]
MVLKAKLGIAPIAWSNDDLPQLGGDTPLITCLAESRQAGFQGVETGGKFPKTTAELSAVLREYQLELVSGWYSGTLLDNTVEEEIEKALPQLQLFRDCGAACLVYGETAGTIQNRQDVPLAKRRRLNDEQMQAYAEKLSRFAAFCRDFGVPLAFHHHMGTAIEDEHDIDRLMAATSAEVGLLFDAGHLVFAGVDPLAILAKHGARINHVHTKDVRAAVLQALNWQRDSFLDAVLKGVYTVPGDGMIDFSAIINKLAQIGYEGWFVVEAEQDPAKAPPLEYAQIGYKTLCSALDKAGYTLIKGAF